MRKWLSCFLILGLFFFCYSAVAYTTQINRGGNLRIAHENSPDTMDPHRTSMIDASIFGMVYENLIRAAFDEQIGVIYKPELATDWEITDEPAIIFELREDVFFHDGSKFNAEVAKWNFERILTDDVARARGILRSYVDKVEMLDEYTIKIHLTEFHNLILFDLSSARYTTSMISKEKFEKLGRDEFHRTGSGTGAFVIDEWLVDDKVIMIKNENYWREGEDGKPLPYLDSVTFLWRPDKDIAALQLRGGMLDIFYEPDYADFHSFRADPNLITRSYGKIYRHYPNIVINMREGTLADHNLRKAIVRGTNREMLARVIGYGIVEPAEYPLMRNYFSGWDPDYWPDFSFDPERAKELVSKSGVEGDVKIDLLVIAREPDTTVAEVLKSMWDEVGFDTSINAIETIEWVETIRNDNYTIAFHNRPLVPIVDIALLDTVVTGAPGNFGNYSNPKVDELVYKGINIEPGTDEHNQVFREVARLLYEDIGFGPGLYAPQSLAKQHNVVIGPLSESIRTLRFIDVWFKK